jgi:hypothetical protein
MSDPQVAAAAPSCDGKVCPYASSVNAAEWWPSL